MRIEDWMPIYRSILADFGFDERRDLLARDRLAALVSASSSVPDLTGQTVAIAGGAPTLESDFALARAADRVIAASDAGHRLASAGIDPDLVVTDLDGRPEATIDLAHRGVPVAVHGHGDNVDRIQAYVPQFPPARLIGTTQTRPVEPLLNYGGFTDGDRAAFIADELGAARLCFPGWDFDDPSVGLFKRRKLRWAERLLFVLERARSERFELLDGRRGRIDPDALWTEQTDA